jgi:Ni/Co efflux regulator RcnB
MKKLIALLAFVAFYGAAMAQCPNAAAQGTANKQETVKCSEADKAKCEKAAAQTGAKCETTGAVATEKSCNKGNGGSCCSKGTTSAGGSCCQKGGTAEAEGKKSKKVKTIAMAEEPKK